MAKEKEGKRERESERERERDRQKDRQKETEKQTERASVLGKKIEIRSLGYRERVKYAQRQ